MREYALFFLALLFFLVDVDVLQRLQGVQFFLAAAACGPTDVNANEARRNAGDCEGIGLTASALGSDPRDVPSTCSFRTVT